MKIPPDALIPPSKITGYLLRPRKTDDKSKYLSLGGFDVSHVELLEAEIRRVTAGADAVVDRVNEHGVFYTVEGEILGPSGRALRVKIVWLRRLDGVFSLVTLVPQTTN